MKFFEIRFDYTKEGVGTFPQSSGMINSYPYQREDSIWNIGRDLNVIPNLYAIQLNAQVKMTDLLSVEVINNYVGLMVSGRFRTLLEKVTLPNCKFYYADVINSNKSVFKDWNYYLFIALETANNHIDFNASDFRVHRTGSRGSRNIELKNNQQLLATRRNPKTPASLAIGESVWANKLVLKTSFNWDLFRIEALTGYLLSEKLKCMIEAEGLTGIRFEPADFIVQKEVTIS